MSNTKPPLQLIDDPVIATLWFLKRLPLDTAATYLALLAAYANERHLLSEEEQARISTLLGEILSSQTYRAA